jgi:hypothetical protein
MYLYSSKNGKQTTVLALFAHTPFTRSKTICEVVAGNPSVLHIRIQMGI